MGVFTNKIDFEVVIMVNHGNPNGDPLNGNRPREDFDGFGEISDVCLKRKTEIVCRIWERKFLCKAKTAVMMDARVLQTGQRQMTRCRKH